MPIIHFSAKLWLFFTVCKFLNHIPQSFNPADCSWVGADVQMDSSSSAQAPEWVMWASFIPEGFSHSDVVLCLS